MMRFDNRVSFDMTLRGKNVTVDCAILAADPDVGIMNDGFEDEVITDIDTGEHCDWELTDDEVSLVCEALYERR